MHKSWNELFYSGLVDPYGSGVSSRKALDYGLDGSGSILGVGGVEIFLHSFRVQTGPGVHSTSYKMSTGEFPRG